MMSHLNLLHPFGIAESTFRAFVDSISAAYLANPYHNWLHAFDVTHCCFVLLVSFDLQKYLTPLHQFALLVAAMSHDVAHPGVNNAFLVATKSLLAQTYNDISVLENFHCATTFQIMLRSEPNLMSNMSLDDRREVRRAIITTILATDMARHGDLCDQIAAHLNSSSMLSSRRRSQSSSSSSTTSTSTSTSSSPLELLFNPKIPSHVDLLLTLMIKLADISNVFKDTSLSNLWMLRITDEYALQGDEMRKRGIPVPAIMDRNSATPKEETTRSFIQHVAVPFFERCVVPVLPPAQAQVLRENLTRNESMLRAAAHGQTTAATI